MDDHQSINCLCGKDSGLDKDFLPTKQIWDNIILNWLKLN